ncbi:MAG: hypothetical protein JO316_25255 [Abitibacteriaceae bacterium]|nr:hypothetical protein [Abditibacteriaceae bacterium]
MNNNSRFSSSRFITTVVFGTLSVLILTSMLAIAAAGTSSPVASAKYARPHHPRLALGQALRGAENIVFPTDAGIIDVTQAPYHAKGDDVTDDTAAIQQALSDHPNEGAIIYLPNGLYLVSDTLKWPHGTRGGAEEKRTILQGQSQRGTVLKLKDNCPGFTDPQHPKSPIWTGHAPAQRFGNEIHNLTVDTGVDNPGVCGIQFMANNQGIMSDVSIVSGDGQGVAGLDLAYTDENGPLLIKNVRVQGFDIGIHTATSVDSETMEHVVVENQNQYGFRNDGQSVSIRDLQSINTVPAVYNHAGLLALIDCTCRGGADTRLTAAVINEGAMLARNLRTSGYGQAIENRTNKQQGVGGPRVREFISQPVISLFPSSPTSLNLPIRETPTVPWDALNQWVSPTRFGAVANDNQDDTAAIQQAIDSGATTVYLPRGNYRVKDTILIRNRVRRIVGCKAYIDVPQMDKPAFKVVDGTAPVVVFENIDSGYTKTPTLENASSRTLVLQHCINVCGNMTGKGDVFLEDVCSNPFTNWHFGHQNIWARQFNVENEGTHVVNDGGTLWVLGLKTERGGTLIETKGGAKTEVLGGLCYTTTAGKLAPMLITQDSAASITLAEVCYNGDPYTTILRETRQGETRTLSHAAPAYKGRLVLYSAH